MKKRLTTREAAEKLGVCVQRISAKIQQGHFPGVTNCECGRSIMIPISDIEKAIKLRKLKK